MKPHLVAVFAHPDDETFLAGGTLASYADRGWDVRLVCATRGEVGKRGPYVSLSAVEFAAVRAAELAAAQCHRSQGHLHPASDRPLGRIVGGPIDTPR